MFAVVLGLFVAEALKAGFWARVGGIGVSVLLFGYLHDLLWLALWRPEVGKFIHEHAAEIEAAG
jgi:hypothetical protein